MDSKQQYKKNASTALKHAAKNTKKLVGAGGINSTETISDEINEPKLFKDIALKKRSSNLRIHPDRGVVYLAHIPHGFYEEEMKSFFKQFGHITRIRLVRSNKTGSSKGYAFIEFRFKEVAEVVAETMNNYLFGNRVLKAVFIPPEKQNPKMFLHSIGYSPETCIGVRRRREAVAQQNKPLTPQAAKVRIDKGKNHLLELQEKLKAQGVDCLFQVNCDTSKRLLETNSLPPSKRVRTSSPTLKAKSSKPTEQTQSNPVSTLKKKSIASKGPMSEKTAKSLKGVKAVVQELKASGKIKGKVEKVTAEKNSVKKPIVKKVVKKVVTKPSVTKVVTSKKDVKKTVLKKQASKKK
ncbi:MKI67 FHA domain-interacting nucleolar phosphoprotein [Thrips palmi]|uniref:MKI67 FHA domain-interacting nucleolar phosphoprotein n=1 Tax=Thrips palmi TaxID=161013 RepID=A0A6P8YMR2_THRPL|nr:MKI67 FHA domain-interacting nucleolar phosphoprotein [Thrips palmi]